MQITKVIFSSGPSHSNGRLINTWIIKQIKLLEETNGEEGSYMKIDTSVLEDFTYTNMNQIFCFSSQSVLNWKVVSFFIWYQKLIHYVPMCNHPSIQKYQIMFLIISDKCK